MTPGLLTSIQNALDDPLWDASVSGVKNVVSNAIRALDSTVEIEDTKYFSHSFVPDFVLSWPKSSAGRTRDVFLRVVLDATTVRYDLDTVGGTHPILLGLEALTDELEPAGPEVAESKFHDVLLTDPLALACLGDGVLSEFGTVIPSAVIRSGEGRLGEDSSARLVQSADRVFTAAKEHVPQPIVDSQPTIEEFIGEREVGRLFNLARIVWEATGGDPMAFPLATSLDDLDVEALRYLLDSGPTARLDFWRSVGKSVTADLLLGVGLDRAANLDVLVATNLDRLAFRHLAMLPGRLDLDRGTRWRIDPDNSLILQGAGFEAVLATHKESLPAPRLKLERLAPDEFVRRVDGKRFSSVTFVDQAANTVTTENAAALHVGDGGVMQLLSAESGARVLGVGLDVAGGKRLECRFEDGTASGKTASTFSVQEFLTVAIPVLVKLSESDDQLIEQITADFATVATGPPGGEYQPQLLLQLNDFG